MCWTSDVNLAKVKFEQSLVKNNGLDSPVSQFSLWNKQEFKNNLDRRDNEKKNSEKNEMSGPESAKKGSCELCK